MKGRILKLVFFTSVIAAVFYLFRVDYSSKLETDVSSLLPQVETEEARLARRLISEEQGRAVYLEINGFPEDSQKAAAREQLAMRTLQSHPVVRSLIRMDGSLNLAALKIVADHRLELLFPKWLADKRAEFNALEGESGEFPEWAAEKAVENMDDFLASPVAMEFARPELMDPLLLNIGSLLTLSELESGGFMTSPLIEAESARYYWLTLAESPLSPTVQNDLETLMTGLRQNLHELSPGMTVRYGGLVKLAGASRTRIQSDILTINVLSVIGVVIVSFMLLRKPWRLLMAVPTLFAGVVGAMTISFLVFDQVNALVLVIGSILIGTSIDYSIHFIFREQAEADFPTKKLIGYACFSTVSGFLVLLFADLALIRQIGVFVGSGLLSAYLMARLSISGSWNERKSELRSFENADRMRPWFSAATFILIVAGGYGLYKVSWKDDIRNLEAPDPELVREDLSLRKGLGSNNSGSIFLSTGNSYPEVFENENHLVNLVEKNYGERPGFSVSLFLSNRSDIEALQSMSAEFPRFFSNLKASYESAGYDLESFAGFWEAASLFTENLDTLDETNEEAIDEFAAKLEGPMAGIIGKYEGRCWSLSSLDLSPDDALAVSKLYEDVTLFSQLGFLNRTLDKHRESLFYFGSFAMLLVAVVLILVFGLKKGGMIVVYPLLGGSVAVGVCGLLFGSLNMFHLIGCFLGGTIALDYALFSIEAYARGRGIPHSVWLSAGTTTASFLALACSSIPVVQSLGATVALIACVTLLLLHSSQPFLSKLRLENAAHRL